MRQNLLESIEHEPDSTPPMTRVRPSGKTESRFMTRLNESLTEKQITKERVATRFPVFKNVGKLWSYDYAAEEKKRFKGELQWRPDMIPAL